MAATITDFATKLDEALALTYHLTLEDKVEATRVVFTLLQQLEKVILNKISSASHAITESVHYLQAQAAQQESSRPFDRTAPVATETAVSNQSPDTDGSCQKPTTVVENSIRGTTLSYVSGAADPTQSNYAHYNTASGVSNDAATEGLEGATAVQTSQERPRDNVPLAAAQFGDEVHDIMPSNDVTQSPADESQPMAVDYPKTDVDHLNNVEEMSEHLSEEGQHSPRVKDEYNLMSPAAGVPGGISQMHPISGLQYIMRIPAADSRVTGSRYFCTFPNCHKTFTRIENARDHENLHLSPDARPQVCPVLGCGASYRWSQHLRLHMKKVHDVSGPKKYLTSLKMYHNKYQDNKSAVSQSPQNASESQADCDSLPQQPQPEPPFPPDDYAQQQPAPPPQTSTPMTSSAVDVSMSHAPPLAQVPPSVTDAAVKSEQSTDASMETKTPDELEPGEVPPIVKQDPSANGGASNTPYMAQSHMTNLYNQAAMMSQLSMSQQRMQQSNPLLAQQFGLHYSPRATRKFRGICNYCGKLFTNSKNLQDHKIQHETPGVRPHKCTHCNKTFKWYTGLQQCLREHKEEQREKQSQLAQYQALQQQAIAQAAAVVAQAQHQAARAAHSVAPPVAMGGTSMSDGAGGGQSQNHLLPSIAHALPVRLDPQPSESSETG